MSKIGRKPISLASVTVEVGSDNILRIKGSKAEFSHQLPDVLQATVEDGALTISAQNTSRESKMIWGLHRALVANKVVGASKGFEQLVKLVGLGYKGQLSGKKIVFSLGFSHKVEYELPEGVTVDIDKSGQKLLFKSHDKFLLGNACDAVRSIRPPEPYKGTGVMLDGEVIFRKAGKTKA